MSKRRYARTARLNELFREILGEEVARLDDERLELVTVTGVEVDAGLDHAVVYYSAVTGDADDDEVQEALEEARRGLQSSVARQTRLRATPRLVFRADGGVLAGQRIDEILRDLHQRGELGDEDAGADDGDEGDRGRDREADAAPADDGT